MALFRRSPKSSPPLRRRHEEIARQAERTGITTLLKDLSAAGVRFRDLHTTQTSLEDIFVDLVRSGQ